MYNRYIPQGDGTFRRNRMADTPPPSPLQPKPQERRQEIPPPCQNCVHHPAPPPPLKPRPSVPPVGIMQFFRNLLPQSFDTEDLLIVLLLLLMAGDCQEDQNIVLLTLVLYLFL